MPIEHEMDGVELDRLTPGRVCDVSSSLGSWLLAEGYAELEMRSPAAEERDFMTSEKRDSTINSAPRHVAHDRRRRGG
jgi:hypothetical protein